MTNYSHLSYEDRRNIEDGLNENKSINQIAIELGRNHSTILREIDRNKKYSEPSSWNNYKINHPDILNFSKSSFYRYIKDGIFEFSSLDFPRIVKYKKRKNSNKRRNRKKREVLINRKYSDFIDFISNNPDLNIVEMDTVEGLQTESDCFLTLLWRKSKFMLIFKLEFQTSEEVTRIFKTLQALIPLDIYKNLFQVILTDNGMNSLMLIILNVFIQLVNMLLIYFFVILMLLGKKDQSKKIMNLLDIFYLKVLLLKILHKKTVI